MSYTQTELNGWDYVAAIEQAQINNGIGILYDSGYLPKSFSRQETILGMLIDLKGDFGKPSIHAIKDGLKLCDLSIPLLNASIKTPMGTMPVPAGARLVITASLSSIESVIKSDRGKIYDVYVDFKNDYAVYNVRIDGMEKDQIALIETILKKEMQGLNGHEYKVTSFAIDHNNIDQYIPRLVDFSFVLNESHPDSSPFLLCCAMDDKGPQVENRLVFKLDILPAGLPAAFWIGKQYVFGKTMLPLINSNIKKSYSNVDILYDGDKKLYLKQEVSIGKPDGKHNADMRQFDIYPQDGQFKTYNDIKVFDITIFKIDAVAKLWGHISINLSADKTSFTSSSGVDSHKVETGSSLAAEILLGIITVGIIPIIIECLKSSIEGKVGS